MIAYRQIKKGDITMKEKVKNISVMALAIILVCSFLAVSGYACITSAQDEELQNSIKYSSFAE